MIGLVNWGIDLHAHTHTYTHQFMTKFGSHFYRNTHTHIYAFSPFKNDDFDDNHHRSPSFAKHFTTQKTIKTKPQPTKVCHEMISKKNSSQTIYTNYCY